MASKQDFRMLFTEEDGTARIVHVLAKPWKHDRDDILAAGLSFFYYKTDQYVLCDVRSGRMVSMDYDKETLGLSVFYFPDVDAVAKNIEIIKALPAIDEAGAVEEIWDYPREDSKYYQYHSA